MSYEIIFSVKASNHFKKLERTVQERIKNALKRIRVRPEAYITKLVGQPGYKLRVGDYRVIMDVDNKLLKILVIEVGHRKNIYGR